MEFQNKVVVVTGGAQGIGHYICEMFQKQGAHVCMIDILENDYFQGDIADKNVLEAFFHKVISDYGHVDYIIHNAKPIFKGVDTCSYEEFQYALSVGVTAPFYLTKLFKDYFNEGACVIHISSSRDRMSQPQSESYTAAKGAISALTHSLAVSLAHKARVNAISPGWIITDESQYQGADVAQHLVNRIGTVEDIAHMVLFLCSEKAGFITGENICIDGGMTKQMIYHDEYGWEFKI